MSEFETRELLSYLVTAIGLPLAIMVFRWRSCEDYMGEWCNRANSRSLLHALLRGDDPEFSDYI